MHRLWADTYQKLNTPITVFKKGDQLCRWKASHIVCINNIIERLNEELKVSGFIYLFIF